MTKFVFKTVIVAVVVVFQVITLVQSQCYDDETGYFPDDQQCDKYIECKDGKLVNVSLCADGLVFVQNAKISNRGICQLPFHADCGERTKLQEPQPSLHCPRLNGYFKHETECAKFWQCVNGKPFLNECPHSLAFNEVNGNCDWSLDCTSSSKKAQPDGVNDDFQCPADPTEADFGGYPEPRYPANDCKQFYICLLDPSGKRSARLNSCAYGLVFNNETKNCDVPEKVPQCSKDYNAETDEDPEEYHRRQKALRLKAQATN